MQTTALSYSTLVSFVVRTPFKTSEVTSLNCLYDPSPLVALRPVRSTIYCSFTPASNLLRLFSVMNGSCSALLPQQMLDVSQYSPLCCDQWPSLNTTHH